MRLQQSQHGFTLWASARDTYDWAHKSGAAWPCSTLAGHRLVAAFDSNGLYDFTLDGRGAAWGSIDGQELSALVCDLAGPKLGRDNAAWDVAVGQFQAEA
mgnify:CR=1 FL=1